jgi:class 3 adenylate cyclase
VSVLESAAAPCGASDIAHIEHEPFRNRKLAAVLFTDIVGSAARAWELGDRAWCELLEEHDELVRRELRRFCGREIDTSDDGFFAAFDGASPAIACACSIRDRLQALELEVRSGVHAGEFEERGARLGGIAVAIGARIASHAEGGEILVSATARDLVVGSGLSFRDGGMHELKGVPGRWRLFAVGRA